MPIPAKPDPEKQCQTCGAAFTRRRFGQRLEDRTRFLTRQFCSQSCANSKPEVTKGAHHWRARRMCAAQCETCPATSGLHVHHKDRNPANNDPSNLATLCGSCHLKLHWREDREKRLAAARSTGASTRKRSADGRWSSGDKPQRQPN